MAGNYLDQFEIIGTLAIPSLLKRSEFVRDSIAVQSGPTIAGRHMSVVGLKFEGLQERAIMLEHDCGGDYGYYNRPLAGTRCLLLVPKDTHYSDEIWLNRALDTFYLQERAGRLIPPDERADYWKKEFDSLSYADIGGFHNIECRDVVLRHCDDPRQLLMKFEFASTEINTRPELVVVAQQEIVPSEDMRESPHQPAVLGKLGVAA